MRLLTIIALAFTVLACGTPKTIAQKNYSKTITDKEVVEDKLWIKYSRGFCFGTCPVYEISIFKDGSVLYNGKQNVPQLGHSFGKITKEQMEELKEGIKTHSIMTTEEDLLDKMLMDVPTYQLIVVDGKDKRHIKHSGSNGANVKAFEKQLDEMMKTITLEIFEK